MKKAFMDVTFELKFDDEKESGGHALEERGIWLAETLKRESAGQPGGWSKSEQGGWGVETRCQA